MNRSALPLGLRPVGAGPEVPDAQRAAGDGVHRRAVGRAVVGHQALDGDAVAAVERDCPLEKARRGDGLLVGQDLNVGQAVQSSIAMCTNSQPWS
jgi:hypothetical protein